MSNNDVLDFLAKLPKNAQPSAAKPLAYVHFARKDKIYDHPTTIDAWVSTYPGGACRNETVLATFKKDTIIKISDHQPCPDGVMCVLIEHY